MFELLLIVLSFGVYWPSLSGEFVFADKGPGALTETSLRNAWKFHRRLTHLTYWLNIQFRDTIAFHVTNTLLHALNAIQLFWIAQHLPIAFPGAHLAGVVYAVHPLCVSAVAYISGRASVLSATFMLAGILSVLSGYWTLLPLFYVLAVLSKEDAVILPVTAAAVLLSQGNLWGLAILGILPLPLFALNRVWLRLLLRPGYFVEELRKVGHGDCLPRLQYMRMFFAESVLRFPQWCLGLGLNPDHDVHVSSKKFRAALCVLVAVAAAAILLNHPILWVALAMIVVSPWIIYLPVPIPDFFENRAYFSAAGISLLWGLLLAAVPVSWFWTSALVWFASRAHEYAACWTSDKRLWHYAARCGSERKPRVLFSLGRAYLVDDKDYASAEHYLKLGLQGNPDSVVGLGNLGKVYADTGRADDALKCYLEATRRCPNSSLAWTALAFQYDAMGNHRNAREAYAKAIALGADDQVVWHRLGVIQFHSRQIKDAHVSFKRCIELKPHDPVFEFDYAMTCMEMGEREEGMRHLDHVPASMFLRMAKMEVGAAK